MSKLTYAQRKRLPARSFVYPKKRKYPIENISHARDALARVSQFGTPAEKKRVRALVHRRYPKIDRYRETRRMYNFKVAMISKNRETRRKYLESL